MTPERTKKLSQKSLETQGRGVPWGKQHFTREDDNAPETIDAPLLTCACCGIRNMDDVDFTRSYREVDLADTKVRNVLRLRPRRGDTTNDDEVEAGDGRPRSDRTQQGHISLMEREPLSIPYNDSGDTKKVELWRLLSAWPAKKPTDLAREREELQLPNWMFDDQSGDPIYFHLHPEFVQEKTFGTPSDGYTATICSLCEKSINEEEIPRQSIAAGVDFGDANRIGLGHLTERERQIISKIRHYLLVIKIESNTTGGRINERGQSAVKGCGIYFDDDSPQVVSNLLSQESINGNVLLQFVGPDGEYDALAAKVLGSANVHGRAWVIYQWLKVLKEVNCHYEHDDELPDFEEVEARVKSANKDLVDKAEHLDDKSIARQTEIDKDDVREVRASSGNRDQLWEQDNDANVNEEEGDFPFRCSLLTSSAKAAQGTDADHEYLVSAANALGIEDKKRAFAIATSRRDRDPLNEYENGDETLAKAFPDVFMFGSAYGNKRPSIQKYQNEHLLLQYTTSAASNRPLLFQLFESMWRHGVIAGMHAKYGSNQKEFEKFADEYVSEEFQTKLRAAIKNSEGSAAKYVLKRLVPVLTFAGRKSVFGALERNESAGQILALGRHFGCATAFLTFGIDDVNHPSAIRFALRSSSNRDFPAVVSNASQAEMKQGLKLSLDGGEGVIPLPFCYRERLKLMINNPVGAAIAYKQMVHNVMSVLFGLKPTNYSGDNNRTTKTEFTSPDKIGIVGTPWAFFGKTETTGSGSLHFHVVKWGGLSPDLLESVADIPELCQKVASVLDSQYCASLDRHVHVQDLVKKNIGTAKGLKSLRQQTAASESATVIKSGVTLAKGDYSRSLEVICIQSYYSQYLFVLFTVSTSILDNDEVELSGNDSVSSKSITLLSRTVGMG